MSTFLVIRRFGPNWDRTKGLRDQEAWGEHAMYMDTLIQSGLLLIGGPLEGSNMVCQLVSSDSPEAATMAFVADPWEQKGILTTDETYMWRLWLGQDRLRTELPSLL